MITNLIYLLIGLFLGLYLGVKKFRDQFNSGAKKLFKGLSKLQFKSDSPDNRITEESKNHYYNFLNRGPNCALPGHQSETCDFEGYCGDCPVYKEFQKNPPPPDNTPVGFEEDYW